MSSVAKKFAGHTLLEMCELAPSLKPLLGRWGMRTRKEWFRGRIVHVQTPDHRTFKLGSFGENHLSFEVFWKGTEYYEPITTLVARQLLRPGDTFIDVGANIGFYTIVLSTGRPDANVIAFEPNPRNFRMLDGNVRLNRLRNVRCEPIAMSDQDGSATLFLAASDMSASLRGDFAEATTGTTTVATARLDSYLARVPLGGGVLMKVDVEGHEPAFFRGAMGTIRAHAPDIITEVTFDYDDALMGFFGDQGYRFYQITDRGLIEAAEIHPVVRGRLVFLNYLLSRKSPDEVAALFDRISDQVSRIDLTKTSKCLTPEAVANFVNRSETAPVGRDRTQS